MSFEQAIDLYLFLVTGFGFWGALTLVRFFWFRWENPPLKALTIFFALLAAGFGGLMVLQLIRHLYGFAVFELFQVRLVTFVTLLTSGVWLLVWRIRILSW